VISDLSAIFSTNQFTQSRLGRFATGHRRHCISRCPRNFG
jgi:hypothetical protein